MDKHEDHDHDLRNYIIGYIASILLSGTSFFIVLALNLSPHTTMRAIGILAIFQLVVQFRFFLHIDGKREHRDDLSLILFSGLVLLIMVLGTLWVLASLADRMQMQM